MSALPKPCSVADAVVQAVERAIGRGSAALHEPTFEGNELRYLRECLESSFVSSAGGFVDRFEAELAAYTGSQHAVAVVNGTAALHLALLLAGVCPNDEVLVPALTFAATANAVAYCGAVPHFVDSEESSLGMDPVALRGYLAEITEVRGECCVNRATGRVIRCVVPMHVFGHPAQIEPLLAVARDFHLVLIEDAAESLGSLWRGRHTGTFGVLGTVSFNGNKTITTGGGGAILTADPRLAARAKHLSTTAKIPHRWELLHDEVGFNYRMPGLNAALGCAQLERLPAFVDAKRRLYGRYRAAFAGLDGMRIMQEPAQCHSNFWLQTLVLEPELAAARDAILGATNDAGFHTRPAWMLMHRLPQFMRCPRMDLRTAESLATRLINLPSSPRLAARAGSAP